MTVNLTPGTLFMLGVCVVLLVILVILIKTMPKRRAPTNNVSWTFNRKQIVCIGLLWAAISLGLWLDPTTGGQRLSNESMMLLYVFAFLLGGGLGAENP